MNVMKTLLQILLVLSLAGCASPFRPVYISPAGDYYLEEQRSEYAYYSAGSVLYADIGFHPWWVSAYNPLHFVYFSPNFYPYYFSVWYPPAYSPYYGYYTGFYSYWCPPYPVRRSHGRQHAEMMPGDEESQPLADAGSLPGQLALWRSADNKSLNRRMKNSNYRAGKSVNIPRSFTTIKSAPAKPTSVHRPAPYSAGDFSRPRAPSGFAPRANPGLRTARPSAVTPVRSKQ